jgi:hypothetical protein
VRGPAAVDRQCDAGDRGCGFARQEHRERPDLLDGGEPLVRLLREQDIADDLLAWDAVRLGLAFDLLLDQRRIEISVCPLGIGCLMAMFMACGLPSGDRDAGVTAGGDGATLSEGGRALEMLIG